jgi:hypothetical protein
MGKLIISIEIPDATRDSLGEKLKNYVAEKVALGHESGNIQQSLNNVITQGKWKSEFIEDADNPDLFPFKSNTAYYMRDKKSDEGYHVVGINKALDRICVAGHPIQALRLSDCVAFSERGKLSNDELEFRKKHFGSNWM